MTGLPLHSVSVAGVTFNEAGQVLLIRRRDNGQWQAPGGVLELDETFEDGVVREVLEETGIRVRVERLSGVYKNIPKHVVALVYRCIPVAGAPQTTVESDRVEWVSLEDAEKIMSEAFFVRVSDAVGGPLKIPASRSHDGTHLR